MNNRLDSSYKYFKVNRTLDIDSSDDFTNINTIKLLKSDLSIKEDISLSKELITLESNLWSNYEKSSGYVK